MAEGLASAVALPDQETLIPSPEAGLKRRKSSTTDADSKRRRLSSHHEDERPQSPQDRRPSSPAPEERKVERRPVRGREEERKRGQRLFGGLLGTLSQGSNSAAQRRRADIERRQQDKLKLQDEEYGELKKKRRDERVATRKKDQRLYEEESMRTRHSNLVAMAHFLKTKTKPVLYYKPWQLTHRDEDVIQDQIDEAEATVARETADFEERHPSPTEEESKEQKERTQSEVVAEQDPAPLPDKEPKEPKEETANDAAGTTNAETDHDKGHEIIAGTDGTADRQDAAPVNDQPDAHRAAEDDGGEVVEDQEDTVIY
ncbi:hypothetical protein ASPWEDRAFT_171092 [Aspergillus wentii DTO 134E9]|uniref:Pinin/SDK/MemA protein domain-containing protein n=1 Tax=Aspergillus wentii DTO 134E9 TaxID=1073089 RepID=A0A1L9RRX7_ASPWE|nr:uncharacterized protein ASPWEDRAFT_171092 [Aspergillus wentii DTO 134E9]OJJ37623.1 hypothetical protein ASPWEDRAFT_171092 [Aspergillus wentii DTO 134E9]